MRSLIINLIFSSFSFAQLAQSQSLDSKSYMLFMYPNLGNTSGNAHSINNSNMIAGSSGTPAYLRHASVSKAGASSAIDLDPNNPNRHSEAWGINEYGDIIGHRQDAVTWRFRPTMWDARKKSAIDLGGSPNTDYWCHDINDARQAVCASMYQGFYYRPGVGLTLLPAQANSALPWAINNQGIIGGAAPWSANAQSPERAALWQINDSGQIQGPKFIGPRPTTTIFSSEVKALNENGVAVGSHSTAIGVKNAFINYPRNRGKFHDLGSLPGAQYTVALSLNNQNEVVGSSDCPSYPGVTCGFVWQRNGGMRNLNDMVLNDPNQDFLIRAGNDINDNGIIVGYADYFGSSVGIILIPTK